MLFRSWYVSPEGNDSNPGTLNSPFKTIQFASTKTLPGDEVILRKGIYRERFIKPAVSGTITQPITYRNYLSEKPVLDFGLEVGTWSLNGGNVYKAVPKFLANDLKNANEGLLINDVPYAKVKLLDQVTEGKFYSDDLDGTIYVYPIGGGSPEGKDVSVINYKGYETCDANSSTGLILGDGCSHFVTNLNFEGLVFRAAFSGIAAIKWQGGQLNTRFKNCEITNMYQYAIVLWYCGDLVIDNCNIHNAGLVNYPRGTAEANGLTWPHAIIGRGSANVEIKNSKVHDNHGEGVGPFEACSNWNIHHNEVYDNWSVNIYVDTEIGDCQVDNNWIYCTGKYGDTEKKNYPDGIRIANEINDYQYKLNDPVVENIMVRNNIIYNCSGGISFFPYTDKGSYLKNSFFLNNTIVDCDRLFPFSVWCKSCDGVTISNNIVKGGNMLLENALNEGIEVSNNILLTNSDLVIKGPLINTSDMYYGTPSFVSGNTFSPGGFMLKAGSLGIDQGKAFVTVSRDFLDSSRTGKIYDIGAYEYSAGVLNAINPDLKESHDSANIFYPNPAQNIVNISGGENAFIHIYNSLGEPVLEFYNVKTLDISSLPNGIYLASLQIGLQKTDQKLIVLK